MYIPSKNLTGSARISESATVYSVCRTALDIWEKVMGLPIRYTYPRLTHCIEKHMHSALRGIRRKPRMRFEEAFSDAPTREEVVTYFLAVLELLKLGQMHLRQNGIYGEIELISGRGKTVEEPEEEPWRQERKRRASAKTKASPTPETE